MTANKHATVRCVNCDDLFTVRLARGHNDANVLALGSRVIAPTLAEALVREFLETPFDGGRHGDRVDRIPLSGVARE